MPILQDRVAIVTGGGAGIGLAAAQALAAEGARIVIANRDAERGEAAVASIRARGGQASFMSTDVVDEAQVAAMVAHALERYGRLDIAFNNAGIMDVGGGRVADIDVGAFDRLLAVDVRGVFLCMKHEIAAMQRSGGGTIINCASAFAHVGAPGGSVYATAKHAVLGLSRSAALEYAKEGIRINSVSPGAVDTEGTRAMAEGKPELIEKTAAVHPIGRLARADEIAGAVVYLASDAASFVTGADLAIDGGLTAQ